MRPRKGIRESEIIQAPRKIQKYPNKMVPLSAGKITRPKWMIAVSMYLANEREKEVVVSFPFPSLGRRNTRKRFCPFSPEHLFWPLFSPLEALLKLGATN